jgi:hypothetical protein
MTNHSDSFQADGDGGTVYGFLTTPGAPIQLGGHFEGTNGGLKAVGNNGIAIDARANEYAAIFASATNDIGAIEVQNYGAGPGLLAVGAEGEGVFGKGSNGVHGQSSSDGSGVWGENTAHGFGVAGSSSGIGVIGGLPQSLGLLGIPPSAVGVWGTVIRLEYSSEIGDGVLGEGQNGVHGRSRSPTDSGVWGENTNKGFGVSGSTNGFSGASGTVAGVWGSNLGSGAGVRGTSAGTGVLGEGNTGVRGVSSTPGSVLQDSVGVHAEHTASGLALFATAANGIAVMAVGGVGGMFEGTIAPLQLAPSQTPGHPTSGRHSMGQLYVDSNGVLYFCTASGIPGTWKTVRLV